MMSASLSLAIAATVALASTTSFAQSPPGTSEGNALDEVTVTAQRVSERLQDVPLSVTALSPDDLQDRQIQSALDLGRQVPNLIGNANVGLGSSAAYYLRGVGQDESIATTDPAVGVYVDGVYLSRVIGNNVLLYDLERVEVLRGPQGTLYGRNTSGGAIKFITRKPDKDFGGYVEGSYELEYNRYLVNASVNVPFTDTFFGKLSAVNTKQSDGFIKNVTTDQEVWAPETTGARAQLRWTPGQTADITATFEYLKDEGQEVTGQDFLNDQPGTLYQVISGLRDPFVETEAKAFTLNAAFDFERFRLEAITGIRDLDESFFIDVSDQVVPSYTIPTSGNYKQWSQEFTLSGTAGPVNWLAGLFYMDEENSSFIGDQLFLFGGAVAGNFVKDLQGGTKSSAAFAEATWNVSDRLSLRAGARYTEERKEVEVDQFLVLDAAAPGSIPDYLPGAYPGARGPLLPLWDTATVAASGIETSPTFTNFNPKLGIDYKINDSAMLFASWTEGFKSGGWNARVTDPRDFVLFLPETVSSFELGLKSQWFDNRVRANVTLYYADYDDFQITAINPASGNFVTLNAAKMRNQGIEGEFAWSISESISLMANIATMDAKFTESESPLVSTSSKVKNTPEVSYLLGADLRHLTGAGYFIGNVHYTQQTDYFANLENSVAGHVPEVGLVDAMVGYESSEGTWSLTASCKNCADKEAFHSALDFGALGFATQFQIPPRQVFLKLRYNF